jgi:prophage regulatory protein
MKHVLEHSGVGYSGPRETILRLPDVLRRVGLQRSSLYAMIAEARFPAPVRLGLRSVGWRESDVVRWISERRPARGGDQ